jgi:hypothetical protein
MAPRTALGVIGVPGRWRRFLPKARAGLPAWGKRIAEFDTWREGYAARVVNVFIAGTTRRAPLFSDIGLTNEVPNPVTLAALEIDGRRYGKFATTIYTYVPYQLLVDDIDQTGVERPPISSLAGEDASLATVRAKRGGFDRTLRDWVDDQIWTEAYGAFTDSSATNTITLNAAIGAAAAQGGGEVRLPAGNFAFTRVTLPVGVVLVGAGRGVTTIRSLESQGVVTLGGDRSGLRDITLDGTNLVPGSIGILAIGISETIFDRCEVKRFDTGMLFRGGSRATWRNLVVRNCNRGVEFRGDTDATGAGLGGEFSDNVWTGGRIYECTSFALRLSYEDSPCRGNRFENVIIETNTGAGVEINGARQNDFIGCVWQNNVRNLDVGDDSDTSRSDNTVIGLAISGGLLSGGIVKFDGESQDVIFRSVRFADVDWQLSLPRNGITLIDCVEDAFVTVSGDGSKLARRSTTSTGEYGGVTTDGTAVTAWSLELEPGQVMHLTARVIGRRRNGTDSAIYYIQTGAIRPGATLNYDGQTGNFAVGNRITGQTSNATARIVADTDSGSTGTLTLRDIEGVFLNNEQIQDTASGVADVNGVIAFANAALDSGGVGAIRTAVETTAGYDCTFAAAGGEIQLRVTGASGHVVEWYCQVDVFTP